MAGRHFKILLLLIFLSTTILVVVLQYSANKNIDALVAGNENLLYEFNMKNKLHHLQNDILTIDNRVRNSVIRNKKESISGIEEEVARVKAGVKELGTLLVTDSSKQLWEELNFLTEEKIRHSYKVLDTLSGSGKQAAEAFINTQKGIRLTEAIKKVSTQLDNNRQAYLTYIIKELDDNSQRAKSFGLVLAIMAITIVLITFLAIVNRVRKQQLLIEQLNESERIGKEAAKIKEHFIANMSHEIRTPLNAILGFTNLLQKQSLENKTSDFVESIQKSSEKLLGIINDVLDLSKIEAGMMRIEKTAISIQEIMHMVESMFTSSALEKKLQFICMVDDKIPATIMGDGIRITQVLMNLVGNAIKFTEEGYIKVQAEAISIDVGMVLLRITIEDSGIGIDKNQLPMIFERFTQAEENITRKYGGTGLGLSIVQQIVKLLNGKIAVKSQLGKGAVFTVELPLEIANDQILHNELIGPNRKEMPGNKNKKILVVEDNPMNQFLMEHLLSDWQFEFKIVDNGKQAIKALEETTFDLVLMDIQMPEMDGYSATTAIRTILKSSVPIIAMTAHAFEGEREKCLRHGMNEYLSKPIREQDLFQLIKRFVKPNHQNLTKQKIKGKKDSPYPSRTINLAYLKEISGGNLSFEKEILNQFMLQAPDELIGLEQAYDQRTWKQLKLKAHNLKTTTSILGLQPLLLKHLEKLENFNAADNNNTEISASLDEVISICNNAIEEAENLLAAM